MGRGPMLSDLDLLRGDRRPSHGGRDDRHEDLDTPSWGFVPLLGGHDLRGGDLDLLRSVLSRSFPDRDPGASDHGETSGDHGPTLSDVDPTTGDRERTSLDLDPTISDLDPASSARVASADDRPPREGDGDPCRADRPRRVFESPHSFRGRRSSHAVHDHPISARDRDSVPRDPPFSERDRRCSLLLWPRNRGAQEMSTTATRRTSRPPTSLRRPGVIPALTATGGGRVAEAGDRASRRDVP